MKKDFYSSDLGKIQMHFHTTIRNVGLYLSVSLALFGAARYYRKGSERSRYRQLLFVILSLAFTFNSFIISKYLIHDHKTTLNKFDKDEIKPMMKWYIVPKMLYYTSSLFALFSIYLCLNTIRKIIKDNINE